MRSILAWLSIAAWASGCGGGGGGPTTGGTPTPAPTPQARLISASPAQGSTASAGRNEPLTLRLEVTSPSDFAPNWLCADYLAAGDSPTGSCGRVGCPGNCVGQTARIPAGIPQQFVISMGAGTSARACSYPRVVDRVSICFTEYTGLELRPPAIPIAYTIEP